MKRFASFDGTDIAYHEWGTPGEAPPVVLHHGFIADAHSNWVNPGVVDALVAAGRHVVGIDARGHGASQKHHDPARYGFQAMAKDLSALVDELGAPEVDLVGYSMGGVVSVVAASRDRRVRRLAVGGIGASVVEQQGLDGDTAPVDGVVAVLRLEDPSALENSPLEPLAPFRFLADAVGADREALVAVLLAGGTLPEAGPIRLDQITAATLVLCGRDDPLATRPEVLANAIPGARLHLVDGDHLSALRDPAYAPTLVAFMARSAPVMN